MLDWSEDPPVLLESKLELTDLGLPPRFWCPSIGLPPLADIAAAAEAIPPWSDPVRLGIVLDRCSASPAHE